MRLAALAILLSAFATQCGLAQGKEISKVDQIFAGFSRPGSPGCSLGVIQDGRFVYRKAYGQASLELNVPLSPDSVFYVGSVSKQFTAASIVLAAEQGYLSLDDDVRKYIPALPRYGHTITLRQMLNQTSGFRDFFELLYLSGHAASDFNSPAEILKLIEKQKGLNNVPGAEWVYSNTNYFLLGIVLQRATGKTLAEFARENIFQPLVMTHTLFYDDPSVVVPGRVPAYDPRDKGGFRVDWSTTYAVVGGGGVMTTLDDLLRWDDNFYANRLGKGTLLKQLESPGVLNSGKRTTYGMGLVLGDYRALPIVEHNGALFGYRADLLRFPEQKFTVITLCNVSNAQPELHARAVADLFLKNDLHMDSIPPAAADKLPDPAGFAGDYLDPRTHTIYSFTLNDRKLQAWGSRLRRKDADQYYDLFGDVITFTGSPSAMKTTLDMNGVTYFSGKRLREIPLSSAVLRGFVGDYRSAELGSDLHVGLEKGKLTVRIKSNPPTALVPVAAGEFVAPGSIVLVFHRDARGDSARLSLYTQSARGISFCKHVAH
ncbi:MAG: serine hydrolase domain-containing protein [Acidobacteriota bacterium]